MLRTLSKVGVSLRLKRGFFSDDRIESFGPMIHSGRIGISTKASDEIPWLQYLTNVDKLKSFSSLCNVIRRFVPSFARIVALLNKKLEKDQTFHFRRLKKSGIKVLESLQHQLLSPPIWSLLKPKRSYTLDCSTCDKQVGCMFLQEQAPRPAKPVWY